MGPEDLLIPGVFFATAAVCWLVAVGRARRARRLIRGAPPGAAGIEDLRRALLEARGDPALEVEILDELAARYRAAGVAFDDGDYRRLIAQYRALAGRGTGRALADLRAVQDLKARLVAGFPGGAGGGEAGR